jgi:hypothetical protein
MLIKAKKVPITIESAKELYQINGSILLTKTLDKGQYTDTDFICCCGQKDTKTYKNFRNTPRCNYANHKELLQKAKEERKMYDVETPLVPKKLFLNILNAENIKKPGDTYSKNWNLAKLKGLTEAVHGENIILLDRVPEDLSSNTSFFVECIMCTYIWITNIENLIRRKLGCAWCKDKCANIKNFDLYTVSFIGGRIHKNRYIYSLYNNLPIIDSKSLLQIWCGILNHIPVVMTVLEHLNKQKAGKAFCCEECEKERLSKKGNKESKDWHQNLERFLKKAYKKHGRGTFDYSLIKKDHLANARSTPPVRCLREKNGVICNEIFYPTIHAHINGGTRCPSCFGKNKYNLESFIARALERYHEKFSYALIKEENVVNSSSKIPIQCNICLHIMRDLNINTFLNGTCPKVCEKCEGLRKWTAARLKEDCEKKKCEGFVYDRIDFSIDPVHGCEATISVGCAVCIEKGYEICYFNPTINNHFNNKSGCSRCSGTMPWNYARFLSDIPKIFKDEFDYSQVLPDMVTSAHSIIPIKHNKCGQTFNKMLDLHMISLQGCSFCQKSYAEQFAYLVLQKHGIYFKDEHPCPGFNGVNCYYDYIYYYNGAFGIIELDGIQHFSPQEMFGGEETFRLSQRRDIHKHFLALHNNLKIIRIDHTIRNDDMEEYILKGLNSEENEFFSTPNMYNWLIEGVKNYKIERL